MYLQGSGKGKLTYEINDEPPVNGKDCTVEGLEDDESAVLQLAFGFMDPVHGPVGVSVSVSGFTPATTLYDDIDSLDILVKMAAGPSWASGTGSSVMLGVSASATNGGGCRYSGNFSAGNLAVLGGGGNALAIKFADYDVTLEPQEQ